MVPVCRRGRPGGGPRAPRGGPDGRAGARDGAHDGARGRPLHPKRCPL